MIESWLAYEGESVGYCFVCDRVCKQAIAAGKGVLFLSHGVLVAWQRSNVRSVPPDAVRAWTR